MGETERTMVVSRLLVPTLIYLCDRDPELAEIIESTLRSEQKAASTAEAAEIDAALEVLDAITGRAPG